MAERTKVVKVQLLSEEAKKLLDKYGQVTEVLSKKLIVVKKDNKMGLFNSYGTPLVLPDEGVRVHIFEDYVLVQHNLKRKTHEYMWSVFNMHGILVKEGDWEDVGAPSEDVMTIKENGRWKYFNLKFRETFPQRGSLERAQPFANGMGVGEINSKWGAFSPNGKCLIPFEIDYCFDFKGEEFDVLQKNGFSVLVHSTGVEVLKESAEIRKNHMEKNRYTVTLVDGRVVDLHVIVFPDSIGIFSSSVLPWYEKNSIRVWGEKWAILDRLGKPIDMSDEMCQKRVEQIKQYRLDTEV